MASRLAIFTLGFDVKFQLRTLSRISNKIDKVLIVRPSEKSEKGDKAEEELKRFAEEILGLKVESIRINIENVEDSIARVYAYLNKEMPSYVIADVSGGMRLLILEVIASLMNVLPLDRFELIIWTENLKVMAKLSPRIFTLPSLDELSIRILNVLNDGLPKRLKEIVSILKSPRTTTFMRLKKLREDGLIVEKRERPGVTYSITQAGRLAVRIMILKKNISQIT